MTELIVPANTGYMLFASVTAQSNFDCAVSFVVFAKRDLTVVVNDVAISAADWTWTPTATIGGSQGGRVTTTTPKTGKVEIFREIPIERLANFTSGPRTAEDLNSEFNLLTAIAQDTRRDLDTKVAISEELLDGKENTGVAAAGDAAHVAASDPHGQYFDQSRGDARYAQSSALAGKENTGVAAAGDAAHVAASDPHGQYFDLSRFDTRFDTRFNTADIRDLAPINTGLFSGRIAGGVGPIQLLSVSQMQTALGIGGGGTLTDLKIEGGTHTPGWVRAAAAPYNVTDAGTAANNVAGINAALATFGTTYTPLRALQPATVDLRGAAISLDQGTWVRQDGVYLDLDGTRISGTAGTGALFRFDGNTVNALNHVGIRGSAVLDGNARTGPIVEVTNTRFFYQTGGVLKVYDFAGDGLIFKGAVAPYSDGLHIRPAVEEGAAASAPNSRGLVLTTSNLIPSGTGNTQRGVFVKPLIYDTGREGILVEGSGCHVFAFADVEACGVSGSGVTATGVRLSRSFGNQILCLYTEVNGVSGNGFRDILVDNTVASAGPASAVTNSTFNLVLGGYMTGSVEIAAGQNNVISAASILGNLTIGSGADQTQLASGTLVVGTLADSGTNTVKQFYSLNQPEMYIKSGTFKRWTHEVGSTVKIGSDYASIQINQIRGLSIGSVPRNNFTGQLSLPDLGGSSTTIHTVTFPTPELDTNYRIFLTTANGQFEPVLAWRQNPGLNGFSFRVRNFESFTAQQVRVDWMIVGF